MERGKRFQRSCGCGCVVATVMEDVSIVRTAGVKVAAPRGEAGAEWDSNGRGGSLGGNSDPVEEVRRTSAAFSPVFYDIARVEL
jgi:diaminopimelate epimerase